MNLLLWLEPFARRRIETEKQYMVDLEFSQICNEVDNHSEAIAVAVEQDELPV